MKTWIKLMAAFGLITMLVGCAPGPTTQPTAAPAKPAAQPTTAPAAKPTAAPATQPTAAPKPAAPTAAAAPAKVTAATLTGGKPIQKKEINVGIGGATTLSYLPYYIAAGLGYYDELKKELSLTINFQEFASGTQGLNALVAGQMDITFQQAAETVTAKARAQDVVTVQALYNSGVVAMMGRKDAGIKTPADLAGKKVGVTSFGAGSHVQAVAIVKAYGLDPEKVEYVALGSTAGYIPGLTSGRVDAVAAGEPFASQLELDGTGMVLSDLYDPKEVSKVFPGGFISSSIAANQKFINENPGFVQAFVYQNLRALRWFKANSNDAAAVTKLLPKAFEQFGPTLPLVYKRIARSLATDGQISTDGMKQVVLAQIAAKAFDSPDQVNLTQFINPTFSQAAATSLGKE